VQVQASPLAYYTVIEEDLHVVRYTHCKIFHEPALKTSMNRLKYHCYEI